MVAEVTAQVASQINLHDYHFTFSWSMALFTAAGTMGFWARWGREKVKMWAFSDLIRLLPVSDKWHMMLEFGVFVVFGSAIGLGVVNPATPAQALAAGFGWTGLFAQLTPGKPGAGKP